MRRTAALASLLAALGCDSATRTELSWPATEPGHRGVGFEEQTVTYTPPGMTAPRTLRLALWYPTADTTGTNAKYMGTYERPGVFLHAKPLQEGPALPILLFSHGSLGFAEQSYFLTEYFASHGFVVAAPDHTGNTLNTYGGAITTEIYLFRPLDISATLDHLYALPETHGLSGRLGDLVAVAGHSFGGYTSFAVTGAQYPLTRADCTAGHASSNWCSTMTDDFAARFAMGFLDKRIRVAVALAPGGADVLGPGGVKAIDDPVLLITAGMDRQTTNESDGDPFWANLDGATDLRVNIPRGGHHSFSITCELAPAIGENDGCGEGFVDWMEAHRIVDTYALAFTRLHLFGDSSVAPLLDGTTAVSTEATLAFPKDRAP